MKWIITIPAILLFALAGCGKDKQSTNELITVDVTASYPKKELILQDSLDERIFFSTLPFSIYFF